MQRGFRVLPLAGLWLWPRLPCVAPEPRTVSEVRTSPGAGLDVLSVFLAQLKLVFFLIAGVFGCSGLAGPRRRECSILGSTSRPFPS